MGNEVTKKDIDALNKKIDDLAKSVKGLQGRIDDLTKVVNSHAGSINKIQDDLYKQVIPAVNKIAEGKN